MSRAAPPRSSPPTGPLQGASAAELARWKLEVDDSAGTPLTATPQGTFVLLLLVDALVRWSRPASPLLALHEASALAAFGLAIRRKYSRLAGTAWRSPPCEVRCRREGIERSAPCDRGAGGQGEREPDDAAAPGGRTDRRRATGRRSMLNFSIVWRTVARTRSRQASSRRQAPCRRRRPDPSRHLHAAEAACAVPDGQDG